MFNNIKKRKEEKRKEKEYNANQAMYDYLFDAVKPEPAKGKVTYTYNEPVKKEVNPLVKKVAKAAATAAVGCTLSHLVAGVLATGKVTTEIGARILMAKFGWDKERAIYSMTNGAGRGIVDIIVKNPYLADRQTIVDGVRHYYATYYKR